MHGETVKKSIPFVSNCDSRQKELQTDKQE